MEYSPFYGIEKGAVLQEARIFNEPHIDPRRCQQVCASLLSAGTRAVLLVSRHTDTAAARAGHHKAVVPAVPGGDLHKGALRARTNAREVAGARAGQRWLLRWTQA